MATAKEKAAAQAAADKKQAAAAKAALKDPRDSAAPPPPSSPSKRIAEGVVEPDKAEVARRPTAKEKKAAEMVSVTVPRALKFTQDDHTLIDYPVGIYDMPRGHAEDSFVRGMGVTIND